MNRRTIAASLALLDWLLSASAAAQQVSTRSLLAELADLASLAEFPNPAYTCRQFSSYDRKSTTPQDAETWFANHDAGQYLRVEERDGRQEHVMMDADGPGAIVRIWSANPNGTLRVYLDHSDTPALEVPMADLLSGKVAGIPEPIAHQRSAGWNSYFPFPYARHCKVTSDQGDFYYHINYRTYLPGAPVVSFSADDLKTLATDIQAIARKLGSPAECGAKADDSAPPMQDLEIQPGSSAPLELDWRRPAAIVELRVKVNVREPALALRQLLLLIEFDGQRTVTCPLGDFFGAGPGASPYDSLPMGITKDGEMWSHWVMPFRRSARMEIRNLGDRPVRVSRDLSYADYRWTERTLHFHAGWRVGREVPTRPFCDWNYVTVDGQGVFVGAAFTLANPVKNWWGEGDEKIYVDGETFPSHFGTGTEDYYGYAWGSNQPFTHAYHNQPRCDGPGNYGRTAVNRWHIPDRIPFTRDFRFDMELWHWWDGRVPEMSVVTYWYARPGASSNLKEPGPDDLRLVTLPPYMAPRVPGALEGEELRVVESTGEVGPQDIDPCSNEKHLWWRSARPGDRLVVAFPAPAAGRYRVVGRFVKAGDYGIVQLSVNGQKAGQPLDLYSERLGVSDEVPLGVFTLTAADNRLTVEIVGANEKAAPQYMAGLDYLRLEPAE